MPLERSRITGVEFTREFGQLALAEPPGERSPQPCERENAIPPLVKKPMP